jgi:hypothetical protein
MSQKTKSEKMVLRVIRVAQILKKAETQNSTKIDSQDQRTKELVHMVQR